MTASDLYTDTTAAVRSRWCEVLDRPGATGDEDFFLTGGHSLLAVRLTAALREDLGVRIPVAAVFEQRTLGAYAAAVAALVDPPPGS